MTKKKNVPKYQLNTGGLNGSPILGAVYYTTDVQQFSLFKENRPLRPLTTRRMEQGIQELNLLKHNPIVVTLKGGIVDGQTRWSAVSNLRSKGHHIGLFFTILDADVDPFEAMRVTNASSSPWQSGDYLWHYYQRGVAPYVHMYESNARHAEAGLKIATASLLAVYGVQKTDLRKGKPVVIADLEECDKTLEDLLYLAIECPAFEEVRHAKSVQAFVKCRRDPMFDVTQISHFYKTYPSIAGDIMGGMGSNNPNRRLEVLVHMHNYRRQGKRKINPALILKTGK